VLLSLNINRYKHSVTAYKEEVKRTLKETNLTPEEAVKVKVKQSRYRPGEAIRVPGS
jgi:hypothetical protein